MRFVCLAAMGCGAGFVVLGLWLLCWGPITTAVAGGMTVITGAGVLATAARDFPRNP